MAAIGSKFAENGSNWQQICTKLAANGSNWQQMAAKYYGSNDKICRKCCLAANCCHGAPPIYIILVISGTLYYAVEVKLAKIKERNFFVKKFFFALDLNLGPTSGPTWPHLTPLYGPTWPHMAPLGPTFFLAPHQNFLKMGPVGPSGAIGPPPF